MKNIKQTNFNSFCMLLFGFACISSYFPPLRAIVGTYIPSLICFASAILYILFSRDAGRLRLSLAAVVSAAFFIYLGVVTILAGNTVLFNRYFSLLLLIGGYPVFKVILAESTNKSRKLLFIFIVLFALLTCIRTGYALVNDPYSSRSIKSEGAHTQDLLLNGVGGYEVVYFAVLAAIAILPACFSSDIKIRIFSILIFSVFMSLVMLSNYMTALIVLVFGCLAVVVLQVRGGTQTKALLGISALVGIGALAMANSQSIVDLVVSMGGGGRVSSVLLGSGSLFENISTEFLVDRAPVMQKSIGALLDYPILGQVGLTSVYGPDGVISQAGQHSFILDSFAYFGFIGGLLIVGAVLLELSDLAKTYSVSAVLPIGISLFILILFNNATTSLASAAFILFPLLQELEKEQTEVCDVK